MNSRREKPFPKKITKKVSVVDASREAGRDDFHALFHFNRLEEPELFFYFPFWGLYISKGRAREEAKKEEKNKRWKRERMRVCLSVEKFSQLLLRL